MIFSKKRPIYLSFLIIFLLAVAHSTNRSNKPAARLNSPVNETKNTYANINQLPISFEENNGQTDPRVDFLLRGIGFNLFLKPDEAILKFADKSSLSNSIKNSSAAHLSLKLINSNPKARLIGQQPMTNKSNYFIGNDPSRWRRDIPSFAKVKAEGIYPGIDIIYYGNQSQLEYDFVIHPGQNPDVIKLAFDGAESIRLDTNGDLMLHIKTSLIRQARPVIYQEIDGLKREIVGSYTLDAQAGVGFRIEDYDASYPLVIDPVLRYATYIGGTMDEEVRSVVVDSDGNAYIVGNTISSDFPTTNNTVQPNRGDLWDVFIMKIDANPGVTVYSTYLGGGSNDSGHAITLDPEGNIYITGATTSRDFPLKKAIQSRAAGFTDAFVTKLSNDGTKLIYSTFLGGSGSDGGNGIAVTPEGKVCITGLTESTDYPIVRAIQPNFQGVWDVFVTCLKPNGKKINYSTYLGGSGQDQALALAIDENDSLYITGATTSVDLFTTPGAAQPVYGGGSVFGDGFVIKLNAKGTNITYSTYLGGKNEEIPWSIAVDSASNAVVTGLTLSDDFPTIAALQPVSGSPADAFVTKLNNGGSGFIYSTYLGGSERDESKAVAVDTDGNAYITGQTNSSDFPVTGDAVQLEKAGAERFEDAFVTKIDSNGSAILYSSYIGGNRFDEGSGIVIDSAGNILIIGNTQSLTFPTTDTASQKEKRGGADAFFLRIKM